MEDDLILRKLELQENPQIVFSDIDGTLFSPNLNLITAPLQNVQTSVFLSTKHIPFIIVTGRSFWRKVDQYHLTVLGLPKPDAVITANGTLIYFRTRSGYISDFSWQGIMQSTKVTDTQGNVSSWNKWEITEVLTKYLQSNNYSFHLGQGNTYLIRIRVNKLPMQQVLELRKEFTRLFPKGIRVVLTEKLLWENTLDIFSGELLITPSTAGKDKAIQYLLKNFAIELNRHSGKRSAFRISEDRSWTSQDDNKKIQGLVFGDASVDIPMLLMKNDPRLFSLSQYAVHPTPLARKMIEENLSKNNNVHLLLGDGPKEILWTLKPELRKYSSSESKRRIEKQSENSSRLRSNNTFSPAQNNKARQVIRIFEKVLDKMVDKNLSPNEISFLGLQKLSEGLALLNKKDSSFLHKTKGWYGYAFGNLTDVLDGIRARNSDKKEENGQLVDGFSDRAKEFMQLFSRAKKRLALAKDTTEESNDSFSDALSTFLASFSCALPSIARAQVEITGATVAERDEKGGSMIDRTRRLFLSLLFDTFGLDDQSLGVDEKILQTNLATFQHRLSSLRGTKQSLPVISSMSEKSLSDFQKKALERFLHYVDILQQENDIIKKYLSKHLKLLKAYEKESIKLAKNYLDLPINKLRKKFGLKDYKLEVKKYIS